LDLFDARIGFDLDTAEVTIQEFSEDKVAGLDRGPLLCYRERCGSRWWLSHDSKEKDGKSAAGNRERYERTRLRMMRMQKSGVKQKSVFS
jgi:hypothetical protein